MLTTPAESWCPFKTKKPKVSRSHYVIGVGLLGRGRRADAVHALLLESVGVVAGWLLSPTPEARWAASCTVRVGVHPLYVECTR